MSVTRTCSTCRGYGLWAMGDPSPMGRMDAADGLPTLECPECKANANPVKSENPHRDYGDETKYIPAPPVPDGWHLVALEDGQAGDWVKVELVRDEPPTEDDLAERDRIADSEDVEPSCGCEDCDCGEEAK